MTPANTIFRKVISMLQNLQRKIFGVGPDHVVAQQTESLQEADEPLQYAPEGELPHLRAGETWSAWRRDLDGIQWYARKPIHGVEPEPEIMAELSTDDEFDDEDLDSTEDIMHSFHQKLEAIKSRHAPNQEMTNDA